VFLTVKLTGTVPPAPGKRSDPVATVAAIEIVPALALPVPLPEAVQYAKDAPAARQTKPNATATTAT
jgi:hypothetical protein